MRYFSGSGSNLGDVSALPIASFAALCLALSQPVVLPLTRKSFHELPAKERQQRKRVKYIVPAAFATSPSPRKTEHASHCNLIALDIDDGAQAQRLLSEGIDLGSLGWIAWHTASSQPKAPRLRVLVSADAIPIDRYAAAVRTVGEMLGLPEITRESLVPVQPMFWPTMFNGDDLIEDYSPIVGGVKT